jgi:hypothetical protein
MRKDSHHQNIVIQNVSYFNFSLEAARRRNPKIVLLTKQYVEKVKLARQRPFMTKMYYSELKNSRIICPGGQTKFCNFPTTWSMQHFTQ